MSRALLLVADAPVSWHLERALAAHLPWCRTNGIPVPAEVRQLLDILARDRHERPSVAEFDGFGGRLAMDIETAGRRLG